MGHPQDHAESAITTLPFHNRAGNALPAPPTGTVTFLFTDIQGSTSLWERDSQVMQRAFARQETLVREAMAAHGGYVYKMIGDAFQVAFSTALAALAAALAAQRALCAETWEPACPLKVRMALHTAVTEERGDDYVGPELNRIARLLAAGHGGQVLLSETTADLVRDHLPEGVTLCDLGEHTLKDLIRPERIYQVLAPGLSEIRSPLRTVDVRPNNLPTPATPFIGRERELEQIASLLRDPGCRLITLIGLGGSGKTRLAIQAAAQCVASNRSPAFAHGVCFVGLAAVSTPEAMLSTIAEALQMSFYVQRGTNLSLEAAQAQLLQYLADRKMLLVLDNMEQLVDSAGLIAEMMEAVPGVKILATSRERLNLPGEWVVDVAGLSYPSDYHEEKVPEYPAVQLFVTSAARAGSFSATASDWPAIARICQLLGGIPLGIEMAAAWTRVLSCQETAAELERNLLALIATWRTVPERHRTLRTVFDHSWRLLSDEEREAFCRLSVFHGEFSREVAADIAGASVPVLSALIDKSLLRRTADRRFELHPALRQYAAEKLSADPAVYAEFRSRHARYYGDWLVRMYEQLKGSGQSAALAALRVEMQNVHDAWRWFSEQCILAPLRPMLPALVLFHEMHGRFIGAHDVIGLLVDTLLALGYVSGKGPHEQEPAVDPAAAGLLALTLAALRHFRQALEDFEQTNPYQRQSLAIAQNLPDSQEKAFTLLLNAMGPGTLTAPQALDLAQQCVDIFRGQDDAWGVALAQLILADAANFGRLGVELAHRSYQAGLEGFTRLGNDWGCALCMTGLAHLELQTGHPREAYRIGCQGLEIYSRMGDVWREVFVRHILIEAAEEAGLLDEARSHLEASLAHFVRVGDERRQQEIREHLWDLDQKAGSLPSLPLLKGLLQEEQAPASSRPAIFPAAAGGTAAGEQVEPLSERELDVLRLLAGGLSNREIGQQLYLSPNTVRVHTSHIYGKLGVNNRTQAVARARDLGLLASP